MDIVWRNHERRSFATLAKTGHASLASDAICVTGGVRSFLVQECNMFYLTLEPLDQSALRVSLAGWQRADLQFGFLLAYTSVSSLHVPRTQKSPLAAYLCACVVWALLNAPNYTGANFQQPWHRWSDVSNFAVPRLAHRKCHTISAP